MGHSRILVVVALALSACSLPATSHEAAKVALLVVDVQNCFTSGGTLAVQDANDVIPIINDLRREFESRFDLVVFSQDWHCVDHVSFASEHPGRSVYDTLTLEYNANGKVCRFSSLS